MASEHEGQGNVVIDSVEKGAKFIRIVNKSLEDLNIGGWTLTNDAKGQESSYKFHRSTNLKPGDVCTVWSADSGEARIFLVIFKITIIIIFVIIIYIL